MAKHYCLYAEPIGSSANLSTNTVSIDGQADCFIPSDIKPTSLAPVDAVIYQLLAMGAGFDPRPLHVGVWWTKWFWGMFYSKNFDFSIRIFFTYSLI
jgi:hypothetical protein